MADAVTSALPQFRVAVFGGDNRVHTLEGVYQSPEPGAWGDIDVTGYPSSEADARRLAASLRQGSFTHVVLLTRWMGHANYRTVKEAAESHPDVCVIHWPSGLGTLEDSIVGLVTGQIEGGAVEAPTAAAAPVTEVIVPVQIRARDAGLTVACYEDRHDDCVYKDKTVVKCGCSCHPVSTEEQLRRDAEVARLAAIAAFECKPESVVEAMLIDPNRTSWRISEIADLLLADNKEKREKVRNCIAEMVQSGQLVELENHHVTMPKAATPVAGPRHHVPGFVENYAVIQHTDTLYVGDDKEQALDMLARNPGAQLYKSVKVRIRYEIEE